MNTHVAGSDAEEEVIDVEGVMQLIQDLEIEPTDKALVRCYSAAPLTPSFTLHIQLL